MALTRPAFRTNDAAQLRQDLDRFAENVAAELRRVTGIPPRWQVADVLGANGVALFDSLNPVDSSQGNVIVQLPVLIPSDNGRSLAVLRLSSANVVSLRSAANQLVNGSTLVTLPALRRSWLLFASNLQWHGVEDW